MEFSDVRELFPSAQRFLYFDAASVTPYSSLVVNALNAFEEDMTGPASAVYFDRYAQRKEVRKMAAALLGADPSEVAFTQNTSQGINLCASLIHWQDGDRVVVSEEDFPANVLPFLNLKDKGVEVDFIKRPTLENIGAAITDSTRLVSISSVMYRDGYRADIQEIGKLCHEKDILLHVDAAQSLGALSTTVENVDFLSAPGYKWLLSPPGTGLFYIRKELLQGTPVLSWLSVENPLALKTKEYKIKKDASRFEMGNPNVPGILAMGASLKLIHDIGIEGIEKRILSLTGLLIERLKEEGFDVISDFPDANRSGIVSFTAPEITKEKLMARNIVATVRDHVRLAPHIYNNEEDVGRVVEELVGLRRN